MPTKTYMPAVKRRIIVRPNPVMGIINYDIDNAYPQRVLELVRQSPTAKKCWAMRAKYIHGNGFEEPELGKQVINSRGLTLAKLLKLMADDKGLFPGYCLHVNYNANYKIISVNLVKYEDNRQGDTDSEKYKGKYVVYSDWGRKTWRSIYLAKADVINPFNPDPAVIKAEVIAAGGWEKYKGQLFYLTPVVDDYALCEFDAALEDIQTEAGIKIFNNRQVETGFLPSAVLFMPARREEADNEGPELDLAGLPIPAKPSQMDMDLATFQGAENAQKIVVIEFDGETPPTLNPYNMQNNDKLFEVTAKSVEANIIKAFNVPKELIQSGDKNGLNASGAEKREAIREFNDITAPERTEISETLAKIFEHWYQPINPKGNWNIIEVTTEGSGPEIVQNSDKVQAVIQSVNMTKDNKVAFLVTVYGFKQSEAEAMIPEDEFIKANIPATTQVETEVSNG